MIDIADIFRVLIPASFRGVEFSMPDSRLTAGRRVQKFLFPARDDALFEDLGAVDGPIQITGVIVGDDYVTRANDLRAAMRTAGPALLVHPWLGELLVVLMEQGSIAFSEKELRIARVQMTVELYPAGVPPPTDTLSAVLSDIQEIQDDANALIEAVLLPVNLTLAAISLAENVCAQVAAIYGDVVGTLGTVAGAIGGIAGGLLAVGGFGAAGFAIGVSELLAGAGITIAQASATTLPAAIGPGDQVVSTPPIDPRLTTAALLSAASRIALIANTPPAGAIALAAAALALTAAVDAAGDIVFTSQQDAQDWRTRQLAAIDQVAALAVALAPSMPSAAGALWRSLQDLRGDVVADINAQIGRLPVVRTLTLAVTTPAWLVAQALVGDNPAKLAAMYADLVARNNVVNPAMMGPGQIEALVAA